MVADVVDKLEVTSSVDVVEIGCGTGVLAVPLAGAARSFVGVDFSAEALDALRQKLHREGLVERTELVELDVLHAPADAVRALGSFDRVLVYATLHYVSDDAELERFLDRAVGLLGPAGIALFGSLPIADAPVARRRLAGSAYRIWRRVGQRVRRRSARPSPALPPGTTVELTVAKVERWLAGRPDLQATWLAPRVGTPMFSRRADLVVRRRPG